MKECKFCKEEIKKEANICPHCRKKQSNKKTIKIIIFGAIIAMLLIILFNYKNGVSKQDLKEYATRYLNQYLELGQDIETLGNELNTYWKDSIYNDKYNSDINEAISQYKKDLSADLLSLSIKKGTLDKNYDFLNTYNKCNNSDCKELLNLIEESNDEIIKFYNLIYSPSGTYLSYTQNFNQYDDNIANYYNKMNNKIKTLN